MKMKKITSSILVLALALTLAFGFAGGARAAYLELEEIYTSYGLGQTIVVKGDTDLDLLMLYLTTPENVVVPMTLSRGDLARGVEIQIGDDWELGEYVIRIGYGSLIVNEYHFDVVKDPVSHAPEKPDSSQSGNRKNNNNNVVTNVTLTPARLEIEVGKSAQVTVTASSSVRWETDDTDLISISGTNEATVTGKKTGSAVAWVYSGNNYATLNVKVVPAQKEEEPVQPEEKEPEEKEPVQQPEDEKAADAFSDLTGVDWARDSINALAAAGVVNGTGDGTFAPSNNVTRAEFVKMIVTAFGFEHTDVPASFSDVSGDEWYADVVYIAAENGIVNGYDGKFSPLDNISCQDAALILRRVADMKALAFVKPPVVENEAAEYARDSVALLKGNGVIDNAMGFSAQTNATRAQSAYMIYNIYKMG